jgi:dTDP-4-amino-4,6-dideoxygalactose transaminase
MTQLKAVNFEEVGNFEKLLSDFFGSPHAIAVDSCTHGIELCLRYFNATKISTPVNTYVSVPMLANKLNIKLEWRQSYWQDYYSVTPDEPYAIYDAAVLWRQNSYIPGTYMCLSFQYQKHLSLGRGGAILLDNHNDFINLKKMSYDGRLPLIPWRDQNIDTFGYHYYMTPETARNGIDKFEEAVMSVPRKWTINDWPDVSQMKVFNQ